MHKSAGNAIDFDEAAERMGVDVMRWMFAKARPEENILFGWHAADEARRELLVLWNVYAFFVTYARLAGWTPAAGEAPPVAERGALDRWILSRAAGTAAAVEEHLRAFDAVGGDPRAVGVHGRPLDLVRAPVARADAPQRRCGRPGRGVRDAPRGAARHGRDARPDPAVPVRRDVREPRRRRRPTAPDSVHLTRWPTADLAGHRDARLERAMDVAQDARRPRPHAPQLGPDPDPPAAGPCLAGPAGPRHRRRTATCSRSSPTRSTSRQVSVIADDSDLVERRVKPLLPKIGKRLGAAIPAVMTAARDGRGRRSTPDGSVTLGGVTLAPDEVEIQASPRPGTAVADATAW